jgi:hypothetical protein
MGRQFEGVGTWLAANVPGWTPNVSINKSLYQSRYLSNSGRLFFNARDALVPQDANGTWDVYEYEPTGVGACTSAAATFSARSGGCVGLISGGSSGEESAFLDASATGGRDTEGAEGGGDVFFLTSAKLAMQDFDTSRDVYDAHECTDSSPCVPPSPAQPAPCATSDSCKASPTTQPTIFAAPASTGVSGAGNLAPIAAIKPASKPPSATQLKAARLAKALKSCRLKRVKRKRHRCESQARRRYGPIHAKKARRAGRVARKSATTNRRGN